MICANLFSDDFVFKPTFDATEFFQQASLEDIVELAKIGWAGDYAADAVAEFFSDRTNMEHVSDVLQYCRKNDIGFECHVSETDAMTWLQYNRPDVFQAVLNRNTVMGKAEAHLVATLQNYADALRPALKKVATEDNFKRLFGDVEPYVAVGRENPADPNSVELSATSGDDYNPASFSELRVELKAIETNGTTKVSGVVFLNRSEDMFLNLTNDVPKQVSTIEDCSPDEFVKLVIDAVEEHIIDIENKPTSPRF
jgi:hypothetical protein